MDDLLRIFGDTSVPVVYAPAWASCRCISQWIRWEARAASISGSRQRSSDRQLKRGFDLTSGVGVLIPLLLLIALAVRLSSPGPFCFVSSATGSMGSFLGVQVPQHVLEAGDQPGMAGPCDDPRRVGAGCGAGAR